MIQLLKGHYPYEKAYTDDEDKAKKRLKLRDEYRTKLGLDHDLK
jgi:hypothetical protein